MIRWHLSKKPEGSDRLSHVKPGGEGQSSRKVEVGVCLLCVGDIRVVDELSRAKVVKGWLGWWRGEWGRS